MMVALVRRRTVIALPILTAAGASALAACSGSDVSDESTNSAAIASGAATAPAGWQSLSGSIMGHSVTVEVAPLVRMDESTTMLPLRITRAADDVNTGDLSLKDTWQMFGYTAALSCLRLVDTDGARVWDTLGVNGPDPELRAIAPGQTITRCAPFGGVDVDHVTAWVPMVGFPVVKVMERSDAEGILSSDVDLDAALEHARLEGYPTFHNRQTVDEGRAPLDVETFTRTLDDSTASRTTSASIITVLSSDVTFEFGKYDLTPEADGQLQTVAGQIGSYPSGGELSVVGHTDDQADEAFNQTLSEQRAAAVHKRLGELTSLSAWTVTEEGKGEKEPAVQGTDDAARAANRRVVLTLTPTGGTTTSTTAASPSAAASGDALPEAKGPVGKGPEGVTVTSPDGNLQATIRLDKVIRRGRYLLGILQASSSSSASGGNALAYYFNDSSAGLNSDSRGENSSANVASTGANGVDLLADGLRYSPCDHLPVGYDYHITLADLGIGGQLNGTTGVCVIWPDTGQDTVTLDHAPSRDRNALDHPWRLTDVPVVDE